jgi:hypothetical protein
MKLRRWLCTEERLLREHYRRLGAEACADLLGRSVPSVWTRAHKIGLTEDQRIAQIKANARRG